jgi:hypothetical protein
MASTRGAKCGGDYGCRTEIRGDRILDRVRSADEADAGGLQVSFWAPA